MSPCFCRWGDRAAQTHHCVYAQHCRNEGASTKDERNLVRVGLRCHAAHHNRTKPYHLSILPDSVFEFAEEVMGPARAFNYLRRYYAGEDRRLAALATKEGTTA